MSDETGQVDSDSFGTTEETPDESVASNQTTDTGLGDAAESFFDPNDIPEELKPAYKQMQGAFTKRMQEVSQNRHKLEAYDAFEQDPKGTIMRLASQYGLTFQEAQQAVQNAQEPQTWDEVYKTAEERALEKVMKQFEPIIKDVRETKQKNVENYLDGKYPDWRTYEDKMSAILQKHPSLSSELDTVYEMAVPREVREARATKAAMAKLQSKVDSSKVSGSSQTTKSTSGKPSGKLSVQEAFALAKQRMG